MKTELLGGHPARILVLSFAALIAAGALLLALPMATTAVGSVGLVDAVFTSTSAVCGGLTVLDTGKDFTRFGRSVLLLLIQLGGLGIMLSSTALLALFGMKLGLKERVILQDHETGFTLAKPQILARQVLFYTLVVETSGFLLLWGLCGQAPFAALFHSISAFCNAGFALPSDNLMSMVGDVPVNL